METGWQLLYQKHDNHGNPDNPVPDNHGNKNTNISDDNADTPEDEWTED